MPGNKSRDCWSKGSRDMGGDRSGQTGDRAFSWPAGEAWLDLVGRLGDLGG